MTRYTPAQLRYIVRRPIFARWFLRAAAANRSVQ